MAAVLWSPAKQGGRNVSHSPFVWRLIFIESGNYAHYLQSHSPHVIWFGYLKFLYSCLYVHHNTALSYSFCVCRFQPFAHPRDSTTAGVLHFFVSWFINCTAYILPLQLIISPIGLCVSFLVIQISIKFYVILSYINLHLTQYNFKRRLDEYWLHVGSVFIYCWGAISIDIYLVSA